MKENKIILISGSPGTGKTTLSIKLADILNIDQLVSTDVLRTTLRSISSEDKNPFLFTVTHESWKYFGERNYENIWSGFLQHCRTLYPTMNYILEKSMDEGRDIIIEGAHITPEFVSTARKEYEKIYHFHLIINENEELLKRFDFKNSSRTIKYLGWKNNLDIIRYIESRILSGLNGSFLLENNSLENTLNQSRRILE